MSSFVKQRNNCFKIPNFNINISSEALSGSLNFHVFWLFYYFFALSVTLADMKGVSTSNRTELKTIRKNNLNHFQVILHNSPYSISQPRKVFLSTPLVKNTLQKTTILPFFPLQNQSQNIRQYKEYCTSSSQSFDENQPPNSKKKTEGGKKS